MEQTDQVQTNCKGLLGNVVQLFHAYMLCFYQDASEVRLGQAVIVVAILHVSCLFHGWGVWILCCLLTGFIPIWGQRHKHKGERKKKKLHRDKESFASIHSKLSWCNNSTMLMLICTVHFAIITLHARCVHVSENAQVSSIVCGACFTS